LRLEPVFPFFTTDTSAALRAIEIGAEALLKGTKVDGVYDSDPVLNSSARRFDKLTYDEVLARNLKVMDGTAISLARDKGLKIIVFNVKIPSNIERVILGEAVGTVVEGGDNNAQ